MNDDQLLRYSRHILLDPIGIEGQRALLQSHALVVGMGGLGSPAALYLGTAGVGRLTLADDDRVDLTNLQRQIIHATDRVGSPKVESAALSLKALNPDLLVHAVQERLLGERLDACVARADVVLDCSDNFATRQALNAACVRHAKPLVSGAAIGFDGQIAVYDTRLPDSPCYACVFPAHIQPEAVRCATMGVFAPLVGIIGSMQAAEALKLLLGLPGTLTGRLQMLDAARMQWSEIQLTRDPACTCCNSRPMPSGAAFPAAQSP
ncbi:MAG: molybdopterin-synthase adenylyltransferase MoeB [Burkholderiaceae bacterium]|nr:molybdopterin-synthase adenylyltransferase MoeB [Burkholderiaceae bacterium]